MVVVVQVRCEARADGVGRRVFLLQSVFFSGRWGYLIRQDYE